MNKYLLLPALATGVGILLHGGSASAAGEMPVVNCVGSQPEPVTCMVPISGTLDSDNDGFPDVDEVLFGSNPFDANSRPTLDWMLVNLANGDLPSFGLKPSFELVTVTPDGSALTTDLKAALANLGLAVPDRLASLGITMAPPGMNLGSIGGTLNWNIHTGGTTNPAPPDAPNAGLYGYYSEPTTKLGDPVPRGEANGGTSSTRTGTATDGFGTHTTETEVTFFEGGKKIGGEFTVTQGKGNDYTSETAILDANGKAIATGTGKGETTGESERKSHETAEANAKADAKEKADKEKADKEKADKEKADKEAADKAAAAKKKKTDGGTDVDPNAEQQVDPSSLTSDQVGVLVAASNGSQFTNTGNTGVGTPTGEVVDPINEIILVNPDGDIDAPTGAPSLGGAAQPEYDPNHPSPQGNINGAPGQRGGVR
jgi:hypothetical protein